MYGRRAWHAFLPSAALDGAATARSGGRRRSDLVDLAPTTVPRSTRRSATAQLPPGVRLAFQPAPGRRRRPRRWGRPAASECCDRTPSSTRRVLGPLSSFGGSPRPWARSLAGPSPRWRRTAPLVSAGHRRRPAMARKRATVRKAPAPLRRRPPARAWRRTPNRQRSAAGAERRRAYRRAGGDRAKVHLVLALAPGAASPASQSPAPSHHQGSSQRQGSSQHQGSSQRPAHGAPERPGTARCGRARLDACTNTCS